MRLFHNSIENRSAQKKRIYLDAHATTCIDPAFMDQYTYICQNLWGNPSSVHYEGQQARSLLIAAKEKMRKALKIPKSYEIFIFSSATEALNTLIFGIIAEKKKKERSIDSMRIVSTEVEHAAVYESIRNSSLHCISDYISVENHGYPKYEDIVTYINSIDTSSLLLGSFMAVNNETGVITQDLEKIAQKFSEISVPLIVDGVAALGRFPISFYKGISAFIFSGHKIHAPKGISIAVVDKKLKFSPLIVGGPQEGQKRAGTENIPLIACFAEVLEYTMSSCDECIKKMYFFQKRFEAGLLERFPNIQIHGLLSDRSPSVSNISFPNVDGEELLITLDMMGISVSHGSACSSGALEPSRVLLKMGVPHAEASSSIRFSWSRLMTEEDMDEAICRITRALQPHMNGKRDY